MLTEDEEVTASSCTISVITTLTFTVLALASRTGYKQLEDTGLSFPAGEILQGSTAKGDNSIIPVPPPYFKLHLNRGEGR